MVRDPRHECFSHLHRDGSQETTAGTVRRLLSRFLVAMSCICCSVRHAGHVYLAWLVHDIQLAKYNHLPLIA